MVQAECESCGRTYKLKVELAGRRAKCACGASVNVPLINSRVPPLAKDAASKTCLNCGITVGALQKLLDWHGKRVCLACRDALVAEAAASDQLADSVKAEAETHLQAQRDADRRARIEVEGKAFARHRALSVAYATSVLSALFLILSIVLAIVVFNGGVPRDGLIGAVLGILLLPAISLWSAAHAWRSYKNLAQNASNAASIGDTTSALRLTGLWTIAIVAVTAAALAPLILPSLAGTAATNHFDATRQMGDESVIPKVVVGVTFIVSLVIPIAAIAFIREVSARRCPNCGRIRATVVAAVHAIGQEQHVERTTESVQVWDKPGGAGHLGTVYMPKDRVVVTQRQAANRHCNGCGNSWTTQHKVRVQ